MESTAFYNHAKNIAKITGLALLLTPGCTTNKQYMVGGYVFDKEGYNAAKTKKFEEQNANYNPLLRDFYKNSTRTWAIFPIKQ